MKPSTLAPTIHLDDYEVSSEVPPIKAAPGVMTIHLDEIVTEVVFAPVEVTSVAESRPAMEMSKTHLIESEGWTWQQLRDYVVDAIQATRGAFPRNPVTEASIFKSFLERWGDKAELIARQAVEVHQCWWRSAPLSVQRFCRGSDPYFAEVLAANL